MNNKLTVLLAVLMVSTWLLLPSSGQAYPGHSFRIVSPNHEQTFSYGTETNRVWKQWGRDNHLALLLSFTNDPFVDRQNPRQYDNFRFDFPNVTLGQDDRTFYYRADGGRLVPVARKSSGFLGLTEVQLLPNVDVKVAMPHGYLTVTILVEN